MAINYINVSIVSAKRGQSAVGLGAYLAREQWRHEITGRVYDYRNQASDLAALRLFMPKDAPKALRTPYALWMEAERRERTVDRRSGIERYKLSAQFAKHVILALPKELTDAQRRALTEDFVQHQYSPHRVGVMAAIHHPDDANIGNHHAHLLVTTREINANGLGKKARGLDPDFAWNPKAQRSKLYSEDLPGQWQNFQNHWFSKHGLDMRVDPRQAVAGKHRGNSRSISGSENEKLDAARRAEARARMLDPEELLLEATKHRAIFTEKSLWRILKAHTIVDNEAKEVIGKAMHSGLVLPLVDPATGNPTGTFTTPSVRRQEEQILEDARRLASTRPSKKMSEKLLATATDLATRLHLTEEQKAAAFHAVDGSNFSLIRGVAGTGKSFTVKAIRETLEEHGYRVLGLAPTNAVAAAMAADNFAEASTLHREIFRQEKAAPRVKLWNKKTCLIVDEAGMVDSEMIEKLLNRAAQAGAKVILVGDEAQLSSVTRGGMFGHLKQVFGCAEIRQVRRQNQDWAKQASLDFAEGNIKDGIDTYANHGCLTWAETLETATEALVKQWAADFQSDPGSSRFVFAGTNLVVDELNRRLQGIRWSGQQVAQRKVLTKRGDIQLIPGDAVQFYANDRDIGIVNGMIGRFLGWKGNEVVVEVAPDAIIQFDPNGFTDWGLGYAGTVYRGQGKTLSRAYALYDNPFSWNARTTYVAMTRHRDDVALFVPRSLAKDQHTLVRQMERRPETGPSITWLTKDEARIKSEQRLEAVAAEDRKHRIDLDTAGGRKTFDLRIERDRQVLWRTIAVSPMSRFQRAYWDLLKIQKRKTLEPEIRAHVGRIVNKLYGVASTRGYNPGSGQILSNSLIDAVDRNRIHMIDDPALEPSGREIDIRPLIIDPSKSEAYEFYRLCRRIGQLDHSVIEAVKKRLISVLDKVGVRQIHRYIHFPYTAVKYSQAKKNRAPDGTRRSHQDKQRAIGQVFREEAAPRLRHAAMEDFFLHEVGSPLKSLGPSSSVTQAHQSIDLNVWTKEALDLEQQNLQRRRKALIGLRWSTAAEQRSRELDEEIQRIAFSMNAISQVEDKRILENFAHRQSQPRNQSPISQPQMPVPRDPQRTSNRPALRRGHDREGR